MLLVCGLLWLVLIGAGSKSLIDYASAAAPARAHPLTWPVESGVAPPADRPLVLMFLHPHCPCSRASVTNLERLMARAGSRMRVCVLFTQPPGAPPDWARSTLADHIRTIPGVETFVDVQAAEAERFGIETSGHVLVYGPDGVLVFSGGLTAARGHEGDSIGLDTLIAYALTGRAPRARTEAFGCRLHGAQAPAGRKNSTG